MLGYKQPNLKHYHVKKQSNFIHNLYFNFY